MAIIIIIPMLLILYCFDFMIVNGNNLPYIEYKMPNLIKSEQTCAVHCVHTLNCSSYLYKESVDENGKKYG